MEDLTRIKSNVAKMVAQNAPEEDIDGYIASEGVTIDAIREHKAQQKPQVGMQGMAEAAAKGFERGASFGFSDEIRATGGGLRGLVENSEITSDFPFIKPDGYGEGYSNRLAGLRNEEDIARQAAPVSFGVGEVGGAIAAPVVGLPSVMGKGIANVATKGALPFAATSGGLGALSGYLYGAGTSDGSLKERHNQGLEYGAYGGLGGVAGASVGSLIGRARKLFGSKETTAISKGANSQEVIESIVEKQDALPPVTGGQSAYSKVQKALKKDLGVDYDAALDAYKRGDISLVELYGSRTTSLAQGAAQYPSGKAKAVKVLGEKTAGSYERVIKNIRENVSSIDTYHASADDLLAAGRAKAAPLYDKAYEGVIDVADENILSILTSPEIQAALKKAKRQFPSELDGLAEDSVKVLDYTKKVLDDDIATAMRAGKGNLARSRIVIKDELLSMIDQQVPAYKKARAVSGDYLSINDAMEKGRKALKTDPELLAKEFNGLGVAEKEAYQIGIGKAIRDEVGKVSEGANPYKRIMGSPEKRQKLSAVLSPVQYKNLEKGLKAEDKLFNLRNTVLGGSPTSEKLEAKELINSGAIDSISGVPKRTMALALGKIKAKYLSGMSDKVAARVSDILYETDPTKKLVIIEKLKASKDFTPAERELVVKTYALAADRYDSLKAYGAVSGGSAIPNVIKEGKEQ